MQKPPEEYKATSGADLFQSLLWCFMIAVYGLGVFWALLVKKPGTVGTRAYLLDMGIGIPLLLALSQNPWPLDQPLFATSFVLLIAMYLWHIHCTLKCKEHVHTRCIGESRFPGKRDMPTALEFFTGVAVGLGLVVAGYVPYGIFICLSAIANSIRDGMIQERDRLRAVQMADALWEQEYAMNNYDRWKRGSRV